MKFSRIATITLLVILLAVSNSGCFFTDTISDTSEYYAELSIVDSSTESSHAEQEAVGNDEFAADTKTSMIGENMLGQSVKIRGVLSEIKRFDSGHASAILTDNSSSITVYFHRDSNTDLIMLITDHEYLISGIVDSYKGELQVLPKTSSDVQLVSNIKFEAAEVVKVVDGDTIHARTSDGEIETIRMIGVDTPELAKDGKQAEFYAEEAHAFTESILMNQTVYLEQDHDDHDQYGRTLRYIWLNQPQTINEKTIRADLFSALLLSEGCANFVHYNDDRKYKELLTEIESEAQSKVLGMWK
ncbi:MAG: hypothetical protein GX028_05925 [Clostridiaceae bacterium]|nr:hypothetical protein [Clostridiaceae bacterium]